MGFARPRPGRTRAGFSFRDFPLPSSVQGRQKRLCDVLRPRDPRDARQRGSARGQVQKLSAGKFHFEPPFTSFHHLVGERLLIVT
jgi:hypothetical protein